MRSAHLRLTRARPAMRRGHVIAYVANQPSVLIDGTPSVPVLSIHATGDLFVPIEMEQHYAREVRANGSATCSCSGRSGA